MKLNQSLRKSIAAALALAMLTVPLSGCSRTVMTGGLSGKGVLGDLAVGGLYGGAFGGILGDALRPPLPDGAIVLELPRVNDERLLVELLGMDALRYYTHARIATEKLSRMNKDNSKPEECAKLLKETAELWKLADHFADMAQKLAGRLAEKEKKPGYQPLAFGTSAISAEQLFFSTAYAEGSSDNQHTARWAQQIVETYEKFPAGKGIQGLASKLFVDTKKAHEQFQEATRILGKGEQGAAKVHDVATKAALVTKGACVTVLFIGGAILTGGATGGAAVAGALNTIAAGADLIIETQNITAELETGETNRDLDAAKQYTGTISAITSGVTLATSFKDFALKGKDAVKATQDSLKDVNLPYKGVLDQYEVGGAGVAAITDSASWAVDRGMELSEGQILGFQVYTDGNGKTVMIPQTQPRQSQILDKLPLSQLNFLMKDEEVKARQETVGELLKIVEEMEKEAKKQQEAEAARKAEEDAKRAAELKEKWRNAPFATSKLAGSYSVKAINAKEGDLLKGVTASGVVHAVDERTIRCVEVLGEKDINDHPEIFTATIDPMTGHGVTSEGFSIQFQESGASFSVTFKNVWGTWRGYKTY